MERCRETALGVTPNCSATFLSEADPSSAIWASFHSKRLGESFERAFNLLDFFLDFFLDVVATLEADFRRAKEFFFAMSGAEEKSGG